MVGGGGAGARVSQHFFCQVKETRRRAKVLKMDRLDRLRDMFQKEVHVTQCDPPMPSPGELEPSDTEYAKLYEGLVHVPLKRSYEDAQQWCNTCLNGRLAVLDSCEKNQAASYAVTPAALSHAGQILSTVVKHANFPGSYLASGLVDHTDQMFSHEPWIGMQSVEIPGLKVTSRAANMMEWQCGDEVCKDGGDPLSWMTPGANRKTVRTKNEEGECWGWNTGTAACGVQTALHGIADEIQSGGNPHARRNPSYGKLANFFWDDVDQDNARKRTFLCEFDPELAIDADGTNAICAADR